MLNAGYDARLYVLPQLFRRFPSECDSSDLGYGLKGASHAASSTAPGLDLTAPRPYFPDAMDLDAVPKHVGSQQAFDIINEARSDLAPIGLDSNLDLSRQ